MKLCWGCRKKVNTKKDFVLCRKCNKERLEGKMMLYNSHATGKDLYGKR